MVFLLVVFVALAALGRGQVFGDSLQLAACENSGRIAWSIGNGTGISSITLRSNTTLVWDISGPTNATGTELHVWYWESPAHPNQQWRFNPTNGQIVSFWGLCAGIITPIIFGQQLGLVACNASDPTQRFTFDNSTGFLTVTPFPDTAYCVSAGVPEANCTVAPFSSLPYCNSSLSTADRAAALASVLTVNEWAALLYHGDTGLPARGVPRIRYSEALHGCLAVCGPPYTDPVTGYTSTGCPTSFPHALLMGGAFNRTLWRSVATAISDEGRALHNSINYALITWAPDINPFRDPRWGRGQEVTGEDPILMSEYIYQYASGLQEGPDKRCIKLVSTAKHFSGYDLENWGGYNRNSFTANISSHDMVSYFWPPFVSATQRGRVHSIMCSYNAISLDGGPSIPSCAWGWANNDVIRGQWGWEGFIVSDCGAIRDLAPPFHSYTSDAVHAAADGILGGTDINCGNFYPANIPAAVTEGLLSLDDLVIAGRRFLTVALATGIFDGEDACVYSSYGPEKVDTLAHRQLAKEAALQGIALLANGVTSTPWGKAPLLPLKGSALAGKTVAVIGPNAAVTQGLLSNYEGSNTVVNNQSVLLGVQRRAAADGFSVTYSLGCDTLCNSTEGFDESAATASKADLVLLVVGLSQLLEREGRDRTNITLPGYQPELVKLIASVGKPIVLVLIHGGPLALDDTALALPTILDAHYPGEMGGDAVTEILFGNVSPSGRLTTTVYPAEYVNQRNMTDYALAAHTDVYGQQIPGVTYLYYQGPTQWPFGFGLSYTSFTYTWLSGEEVSNRAVDVSDVSALPPFAVNVTNTGSVTSDVSALAFLSTGIVGEPIQQLFDFQRASGVGPGETVTLFFSLPPELMARVSAEGSRVLSPGTKVRVRIGDVPREGWSSWESSGVGGSYVSGVLDVTGEGDVVLSSLPPRA